MRAKSLTCLATSVLVGVLLSACGPQSDRPDGIGVDLGAAPAIINNPGDSNFPDPVVSLQGRDFGGGPVNTVVFKVDYIVTAEDADQNMRYVELDIVYSDLCNNGRETSILFTEDIPVAAQVVARARIEGRTTSEVAIPRVCLANDGNFQFIAKVRDFRGLLSENSLSDTVRVAVGQGGNTGGGNNTGSGNTTTGGTTTTTGGTP